MAVLLNALYLSATVLFLVVVSIQTLRTAPPPEMRPGWPLRRFWIGDGLRRTALVFAAVAAVAEVTVVITGGVGAARDAYVPGLLAGALGLTLAGAAAVTYSVLLYRRPSAPEPEGF